LDDHRSGLEAHFGDHPPATVKEAAAVIEKRTGLRRSLSQVRQFMQGWGLRRRKVGSVPTKADPVEQEAFKIQKLEPRLKVAQAGQHTVFFIDAAHFVFAPFLGSLWSFTRRFVKAPSGCQRFNVLRALNAHLALLTLRPTRSTAGGLVLGGNIHRANVEPFFRGTFPTTGPKQAGFIALVAVGVKRQAPAIGLP
jgi:hypothetical protein